MPARRCSECSLYYPIYQYTTCGVCGSFTWVDSTEELPANWLEQMKAKLEPPDPVSDEAEKAELWRLHILLTAGYPMKPARAIAASHADLHRACDLLAQGCPPTTAAEILT